MDNQNKSLKLSEWLESMERGDITPERVRELLMDAGAAESEADEIIAIAQGGSDLVRED